MTKSAPMVDSGKSLIGQPIDRVDGELKVTGAATYAYEHASDTPVAFGYILGAGIARGRITAMDTGRPNPRRVLST